MTAYYIISISIMISSSRSSSSSSSSNSNSIVYIYIYIHIGVPITCTEEHFKNYFEPYGPITKAPQMHPRQKWAASGGKARESSMKSG